MASIAIRKNYVNKDDRPYFKPMRIEDAKFMFKPNFQGRCDQFDKYNRDHERHFNVRLFGENIDRAIDENYNNVQHLEATVTEDGNEYDEAYCLKVIVNFDNPNEQRRPKIYVTKNNIIKATYDQEDDYIFQRLDKEKIREMNMIVTPSTYWSEEHSCWRTSIYLKALYVEFEEEDYSFGGKYRYENETSDDMPEELPFY